MRPSALALAAAATVVLATAPAAGGPVPQEPAAAPGPRQLGGAPPQTIAAGAEALPDLGVPDERLRRLFTPLAAPAGTYAVYRSDRPIAALVEHLRRLDRAPRADAWRIAPMAPGDAFGSSAPYDAARVARLYVSRFPQVARGSLRTPDGVVSFTLVSPWPDADLASLQPGTMTIVFRVTRLTGLR